MKHLLVKFQVEKDKIEYAKFLISAFISEIKQNEPGTAVYKSFQETNNPAAFVHIMSFIDKPSEVLHRNTDYVNEFVHKLYPICIKEPIFTELDLLFTK